MALSPILLFFYNKTPFATFVVITAQSAIHRLGLIYDPFWISDALFYFALGLYAVKYIAKVLSLLDSIRWGIF